jgi:hypothetical protein
MVLFKNQKVPNIIGSILGFAQVSLFAKFPSKSVLNKYKAKLDDSVSSY